MQIFSTFNETGEREPPQDYVHCGRDPVAGEVGGRAQSCHAEATDGQGETQEQLSSGLVDH